MPRRVDLRRPRLRAGHRASGLALGVDHEDGEHRARQGHDHLPRHGFKPYIVYGLYIEYNM